MAPAYRFTGRAEGDLGHAGRWVAVPDVDRAVAARRAAVRPGPWTWLRQVHGDRVVTVTSPGEHAGERADAAVTAVAGCPIAVLSADCAPVILLAGTVVGVAHAGWRGLAAGVLERTREAMAELGAGDHVTAILGPCIRSGCYEFGAADLDSVAARLGDDVRATTTAGRPALDLVAGVRASLALVGVTDVRDEGVCTACSTEHFSHRARGDAGRQAAVAWLTPAREPPSNSSLARSRHAEGVPSRKASAMATPEIVERLARVWARIETAGGDPDRITLVAVTKGFGMDAVRLASAAGLTDVGENYVGELAAKMAPARLLQLGVRWHFLGHVQRNKVRQVANGVALWHGLDRVDAGREIARRAPGAAVLVQVNVTGDPARNGCDRHDAPALVGELRDLGLDVRGLMAVGPGGDPEDARPAFHRLSDLRAELGLAELSIGMSDDLEVAVEEGATIVRIGSALFGPRPGPRRARG